jgi:hypothetical protein
LATFSGVDRGSEAGHGVIAGMDLHQQRGFRADGLGVVLLVRAIGGANLHQPDLRPAHHVGDAKGAADLDQLAARHHRLLALGQRVQRQQHGGGVVC